MIINKAFLDKLAREKNTQASLFAHPDPLQIASIYKDPYISLICALFAYGNAALIVSFLKKLDFSLLDEKEANIRLAFKNSQLKYRFENTKDIEEIFCSLARLKTHCDIEELSFKAFCKQQNMKDAIKALIAKIYSLNPYRSRGYSFYFGSCDGVGAYKRYNMYYRWMVRKDALDLGLFTSLPKSHLLIPLDTHTQSIALKYGLLKRKTHDFKAVLELSSKLASFDPLDPIKYDFALYRLGQLKLHL